MKQKKDRTFHHVTATVFCKPHDNNIAVLAGLDAISPVPMAELLALDKKHDPERPRTVHHAQKDITLTIQQVSSDDGTVSIYTVFFRKISWVNAFSRKLFAAMTKEERQEFSEHPAELLDSEGKLSLRLDKELLMQGKLSLTDDGNCYQIKASVAAFPKSEEQVMHMLRAMLQ
jgi:hypothetical protein